MSALDADLVQQLRRLHEDLAAEKARAAKWERRALDAEAEVAQLRAQLATPAVPPAPPDEAEWSRPRLIRRLLSELGLSVPQRLRAPLFDELVARLHQQGMELKVIGPVSQSGTPGIRARVRLRRRASERERERERERRMRRQYPRPVERRACA